MVRFYDDSPMVPVPKDSMTSKGIWRAAGADKKNAKSLHAMIGARVVQDDLVAGVDI